MSRRVVAVEGNLLAAFQAAELMVRGEDGTERERDDAEIVVRIAVGRIVDRCDVAEPETHQVEVVDAVLGEPVGREILRRPRAAGATAA